MQYLEQTDDQDVMETELVDLEEDDTFKEYLLNIDHSIYMGLVRYATSMILPLCELEITSSPFYLTEDATSTGQTLFHKIKEIYAVGSLGEIIPNIPYTIIGKKIYVRGYSTDFTYFVVYYPTIHDLEHYISDSMNVQDVDDIDDLDLAEDLNGFGLNVPDEMAINIKYLVYSDLKVEENPDVANINKNYFESYLSETARNQVFTNQVEIITRGWGDVYGDGDE